MKRFKGGLAALVVIGFMMSIFVKLSYAQPNIPKGNIPSNIPSDVRNQIEMLFSSNPIQRGYGSIALGNMGTKAAPAIPFLIGILGDRESLHLQWFENGIAMSGGSFTSLGEVVANTLVKIGEPAIKPLVAALKDMDSWVRNNAEYALVKIGEPAIEPLLVALKDKVSHARSKAAKVLGEIALSKIEDPRIVESLAAALKNDEDSDVRSKAMGALKDIWPSDPRTVEPLIAALKDKDSGIRYSAVYFCMQFLKDTRAVEPLITILKEDDDESMQAHAAIALGNIGDTRAVEPLIAALKSESNSVRERAAGALGQIKDPRAVGPLTEALEDKAPYVQNSVKKALKMITGKDFR